MIKKIITTLLICMFSSIYSMQTTRKFISMQHAQLARAAELLEKDLKCHNQSDNCSKSVQSLEEKFEEQRKRLASAQIAAQLQLLKETINAHKY